MTLTIQAHLLLLLSAVIWGTLHPISKLLLGDGLTPAQLALARLGLAALTTLVAAGLTGRLLKLARLGRRDLMAVAAIGFCGYFLAVYLSLRGLELLPASLNALLSNTSPLFVALLAPPLLRERPGRPAIGGLLVGFVGVAILILSRGGGGQGEAALLGVLFSLASSCSWSLYTTLGRWSTARVDPLLVTLIASFVSLPPLAALVLAEGRTAALASAGPAALLGLAWLGIVATGLTFFIWTAALRRLPAASVAAYGYLIPAFGVLFAFLLLGEQPTAAFLLGAALVLVGVVAAQR